MSGLGALVAPLLAPREAVQLQYEVKGEGPSPSHPDCYDVEVEVPAGAADRAPAFLKDAGKELELTKVRWTCLGWWRRGRQSICDQRCVDHQVALTDHVHVFEWASGVRRDARGLTWQRVIMQTRGVNFNLATHPLLSFVLNQVFVCCTD